MSTVASPAFVVSSSVHVLFSVATKQGVKFVHPAVFPTPPSLLWSLKESESREEEETVGRGEGGGHSIGTPRHSEGNHPKYFPLCVARALRLLLHAHTHT